MRRRAVSTATVPSISASVATPMVLALLVISVESVWKPKPRPAPTSPVWAMIWSMSQALQASYTDLELAMICSSSVMTAQ